MKLDKKIIDLVLSCNSVKILLRIWGFYSDFRLLTSEFCFVIKIAGCNKPIDMYASCVYSLLLFL